MAQNFSTQRKSYIFIILIVDPLLSIIIIKKIIIKYTRGGGLSSDFNVRARSNCEIIK